MVREPQPAGHSTLQTSWGATENIPLSTTSSLTKAASGSTAGPSHLPVSSDSNAEMVPLCKVTNKKESPEGSTRP